MPLCRLATQDKRDALFRTDPAFRLGGIGDSFDPLLDGHGELLLHVGGVYRGHTQRNLLRVETHPPEEADAEVHQIEYGVHGPDDVLLMVGLEELLLLFIDGFDGVLQLLLS